MSKESAKNGDLFTTEKIKHVLKSENIIRNFKNSCNCQILSDFNEFIAKYPLDDSPNYMIIPDAVFHDNDFKDNLYNLLIYTLKTRVQTNKL